MTSRPQFPMDPLGIRQPLEPGALQHVAGLSLEQRVAELERGALGRPGPGVSNGSFITSDTTQVGGSVWRRRAVGRMYCATNQLVANNSETRVTATWTQEYETDSTLVDVDTANSRIYARRAAYYRVAAGLQWATSTTTLGGYMAVKTGGVGYAIVAPHQNVGGFYPSGCASSDIIFLAANDYIELFAYWQYGGAATNHTVAGGARYSTFLSLQYIGE